MSNLNSLLESSNQWKSVQSDSARLAAKWDKTGLLEGLGSETEKNNMSLILENQAKQLVVESSQTGGGTTSAGTFTAGQGEQWAGIALPLVRKVFGQISAKEFVSVQPMSLPSGLVFFLDFQYGGAGANNANDTKFTEGGDVFGNGSMYGVTDTAAAPTKGLYGAGKWTYSSNVTSSVVAAANVTSASATWQEVGYDSVLSASIAADKITKYTFAATNFNSFADKEGVRGFFVTSGGGSGTVNTDAIGLTSAYNTFDGTNFILFTSTSFDADAYLGGNLNVVYTSQPTDQFRGDFEDGNTSVQDQNTIIDIPEINIKMKSEAIVAKTKKT
jgi:hypothetical protein